MISLSLFHGTGPSLLEFYSLIASIPKKLKKLLEQDDNNTDDFIPMIDRLIDSKSLSQFVYKLLKSNTNALNKIQEKWVKKNVLLSMDQISSGLETKKIKRMTRYRSFQYRLMHRAILLNDRLFYYQIVQSQNCSFCHEEKETYEHLFYACPKTQQIANICIDYIRQNKCTMINWVFHKLITNNVTEPKSCFGNLVSLIFKQKIYSAKCQGIEPSSYSLIQEVRLIKAMELNSCKKSQKEETT